MSPSQPGRAGWDEPRRDSWQQAWQLAASLAVEGLAGRDLAECCRRSGARWDAGRQVAEVDFLGRLHEVGLPGFAVARQDGGEVEIRERILLLHYLQSAGGRPLAGEWIGFSQVPGAELYLANFRARSADRIGRAFGAAPERLLEAARALGGVPAEPGDAAVRLDALPRVPVLVQVWAGDDEFPPSGELLFDATVTGYLPAEDIIVTAEKVATRLCQR